MKGLLYDAQLLFGHHQAGMTYIHSLIVNVLIDQVILLR